MDEKSIHDLISVPEAAKRAEVSRDTMRRAAKEGTIKAIKPSRNWLVYASDVARWKREHYRPDKAYRHPPKSHSDTDDTVSDT